MLKKKYQSMPGLKYIIKIHLKIDGRKMEGFNEKIRGNIQNNSMWIAYEYGKRTLTERLYRIR